MSKVSAILKNELADLRDRYRVDISGLSPEEIIKLVHACEKMSDPFCGDNRALLDFPIESTCGIKFYSLSLGASIWLNEYANAWWGSGKNEFINSWAWFYALAHSRDKFAFQNLTDRSETFDLIKTWALSLNCPQNELEYIFKTLVGADDGDDGDTEKKEKETEEEEGEKVSINYTEIVSRLEAETGIPADQWLWGRSLYQTIKTYDESQRMIALRFGETLNPLKDELSEAVNSLAKIKRDIWVRMNGEKKDGR